MCVLRTSTVSSTLPHMRTGRDGAPSRVVCLHIFCYPLNVRLLVVAVNFCSTGGFRREHDAQRLRRAE